MFKFFFAVHIRLHHNHLDMIALLNCLVFTYHSRHFNDTSTILRRYFNDVLSSKYGRSMVEVWSKYGRRAGEGRSLALWMWLFACFRGFIALCYSVLCQNCTSCGAPALIFADFAPCYPCSAPL